MAGPVQVFDGSVTPDGYSVNTSQPPYQPSGAPPAAGGNPDLAASIGEDFNTSGYPGVMKSWLEGLKEVSKRGYVSSYNMAQIYARLGDKSQALASLETALEQRDSNLTYVKVEPAFDNLRSDPRFKRVVQQLNMPQ